MSIHKAPSGKYLVRYRLDGKNRGKSFTKESDAVRFESDVKRRKEIGEQILTRRDIPTLEQEAKSWLASKQRLSPVTEALYADRIRLQILPTLGGMKVSDIYPRRVEQWQQDLVAKKTSARTIQQARMILSQILKRSSRHGFIRTNPVPDVDPPHYKADEVEPATVDQVEAMRTYFLERGSKVNAALISVLAYGGLRPPQETHALMWSDLDGDRLTLRRRNVYGKIERGLKAKKEQRTVLLPRAVTVELAELHLALGRPVGLIFPRSDGQPINKSDWGNWSRRIWRPARDAAGLPKTFNPYALRHTCASLMVASGRSVVEVAKQLGHSPNTSLGTYQHVIEEMEGKPIVPFDELIDKARGPRGEVREIRDVS